MSIGAQFNSMYAALAASPGGPITLDALREIAGGDRRFGIPRREELFTRNIDELKAWVEPQFKRGAIELSVVGDVPWDEACAAVARTLGALPGREERRATNAAGAGLKPAHAPLAPKVYAMDRMLRQGAIAWYFPIAPPKDVREIRRCYLLAYALTERLRVRLREELGAAYAVNASFVEVNGFPNLNHFVIYAEIAPPKLDQAMQIVQRETMTLTFKGLDPDEFARAKAPYLRDMDDNLRTNIYWGTTVLSDTQQHPSRLTAARDRASDNAAITREELAVLAKRHLDTSNGFKFAIVPALAAPTAAAAGQGAVSPANLIKAFETKPVAMAPDDAAPVPLYQPHPTYPKRMLDQSMRGQVIVDFIVESNGSVQTANAVQQTNEFFAQAAIDCVKQWKFKPGIKAGKAVPTHLQVPVIFEPRRSR